MQQLGVDRLGLQRLGQIAGATGGTKVSAPAPELPDGVWNPAPGTWAQFVEHYVDIDARIHVGLTAEPPFDFVQVPFSTFPIADTGWPYFSVNAHDIYRHMTRIVEFTAPMERVQPGHPIRVLDYQDSPGYQQIEYVSGAGEDVIGQYTYYGSHNLRVPLSFVRAGQRVREVNVLMQVDTMAMGVTSVDGEIIAPTIIPLPEGVPFPLADFTINPVFKNIRIGFTAGSPLSDDITKTQDGTDPGLVWIADASNRSNDNEITEIQMWSSPTQSISSGTQTLNANGSPLIATGE